MDEQQWSVDLRLDEHMADGSEMSVSARARLAGLDGVTLEGAGRARLFARHSTAVTISKKVAVARALADLSHRLLRSAADEEAVARRANRAAQDIGSPAQPDIG
ncbi:dsRBD fold-containing protein [Rhodococcus koreensis]